jgi:hypothetical protein
MDVFSIGIKATVPTILEFSFAKKINPPLLIIYFSGFLKTSSSKGST